MASDDQHKGKNEWFIGISKSTPNKIKVDLGLDKKASLVDFIIDCPDAKEIFSLFKQKFECQDFNGSTNVVITRGEHSAIADVLLGLAKEYEYRNPSLTRMISRWLGKVESWERQPDEKIKV